MSTISAQLLVTGSSLTEDFYRLFVRREAGEREVVTVGRLSIVAVAAVAMLLAQNPNGSVLKLVANAWAGFGAAFGPVILLALMWPRMTRGGALAGMLSGAAVVILWIARSEEHTSELQTLMRISDAFVCSRKKQTQRMR